VAFAYVDPGTGALLVQGLLGALAAVSLFWRRVKNFLRRLFGGKPVTANHGIDDDSLNDSTLESVDSNEK
jgi:hypothetical protein